MNDMIQITTSEFRKRQASILDLVDSGKTVVIRRGRKSYTLTPVNEDELYFTPEMYAKIDRALEEAKRGEVYSMQEGETLEGFLDRMKDKIKDDV